MNFSVFLLLSLSGMTVVVLFLGRGALRGGFERDAFPTPGRRTAALLLLFFLLAVFVVVPFSSGLSTHESDREKLSAGALFATPATIIVFLSAYYVLSGKKPLLDFLALRTERPLRLFVVGLPIAAVAWASSIAGTIAVQLVFSVFTVKKPVAPHGSPLVSAIVSLSTPTKIAIVLSAMIFEEIFFRSFLQPRVGAVGSTVFFTLAHGVYGEPMMLVGILILSSVLAVTFQIYKNVLPCMAAHGAFDAFQLFVMIPVAMKFVT
jgi:membrane protease YdiL (CAAX protease family)